ncbi:MAG: M13 family metallopeptidase [Elusimicrobia bacterium]|nr:M13 family metallopeptidase [Elusimicrobiota bacterium]
MTNLIPLLLATLSVAQPVAAGETPSPYGFSTGALDKTADPCADFYQFACGGWLKDNEIPADQSRWGRFQELAERNKANLRGILEARMADDPKRDAVDQKIGDYYAACMDEQAIEAKGLSPLRADLDRLDSLKREELPALLALWNGEGVDAALSFGSGPDYDDARMNAAQADQGGLGLPDRDYYFKTDEKSVELRRKYLGHVTRMLALLGDAPDRASAGAKAAFDFEVALASASQDRVFRRDPRNLNHKMSVAALAAAAPGFDWAAFFRAAEAPAFERLNVVSPEFAAQLGRLAAREPLESWRAYLRWQLVHAHAPALPKAFVDEDFAFYGKTLSGAQELKPRWKRCVEQVDARLGEALGKRYVEQTFGSQGKKRTLAMVKALEKALGADIRGLDWMTPATKKQASVKLDAIANKIGYPDRWRDYSTLRVVRGDALGNAERGARFESKRQIDRIGKPVDRNEWDMTPPTVNAYYNPQTNDINFPAGILQPPFYDNALDDGPNFGGIGAVIGHEMTHGFDDEGRRFDAKGDLKDWWTASDGEAFEARARCLVDEYSSFTAVGDVRLNGKLTLGENTADNGGLRIAFMALKDTTAKDAPPIDGFTPEQRFFLGWGQVWCMKTKPEAARLRAMTDPHSPGRERVNGVVRNMAEFAGAFGCKAGSALAPADRCRVW